jgi:UrcA family protein
MSKTFYRRPALRCGVLAAVWFGSAVLPALAADASVVLQSVTASDLDLASANGVAMLHHRIDVAAVTACRDATDGQGVGDAAFSECYARSSLDAWQQAQVRIAAARDGAAVASAARP